MDQCLPKDRVFLSPNSNLEEREQAKPGPTKSPEAYSKGKEGSDLIAGGPKEVGELKGASRSFVDPKMRHTGTPSVSLEDKSNRGKASRSQKEAREERMKEGNQEVMGKKESMSKRYY